MATNFSTIKFALSKMLLSIFLSDPKPTPSKTKKNVIVISQSLKLESHLFSRARKKGFSFFSCGATSSRTVPKTQPLEVAFSLRERVGLRSQKGRILGKKIAWGREGWTGKKKEKRMHKKKVGIGNEKSARSFSAQSFLAPPWAWMSAPKRLFSQGFKGLPGVFAPGRLHK